MPIFLGRSKISCFKSSSLIVLPSALITISEFPFPNNSAKCIAKTANNTTCDVYAFVDATAISGPACV